MLQPSGKSGLLGVIGGMGPAATADFYRKLVAATPAMRDQDHIPLIVLADPRIEDRSAAYGRGEDVAIFEALQRRAQRLIEWGADALVMPCNTAHIWLPRLQAETSLPFISMIESAVREARRRSHRGARVRVLGTQATVRSDIYGAECARQGCQAVYPTSAQQAQISALIAQVKAGAIEAAQDAFGHAIDDWVGDADTVLLACTELPIAAANRIESDIRLIDTSGALVHACLAWAGRS